MIAEAHRACVHPLYRRPGRILEQVKALFLAAPITSPSSPIMGPSTLRAWITQASAHCGDLHHYRHHFTCLKDTLPYIAGQIARTAQALILAKLRALCFSGPADYTGRASHLLASPGMAAAWPSQEPVAALFS